MDDPMGDFHDFSGWRSCDEESSDDGMDTKMDTTEDKSEGKHIPGLTADQQKVLAVVENNDTEEGADIASDFAHLDSKFRFSIQDTTDTLLLEIVNNSIKYIFSGQRQTSRNSELVER